jgi:uncharacterized membrane protein (DUF106 family)
MLETLNDFCTHVMDYVLGWSLSLLPRDLILLLVAILTSVILTGVRSFTTNQGMLKRMKEDKARLAQLIREAKARKDKEAVKRYKGTVQLIGVRSFKYEGLPLLASIVPIAMLAVWAFARLAYVAPVEGQKMRLAVDFPAYAHGDLVTLVPQDGMTVEGNTWVRQVQTVVTSYDALGRQPVALEGNRPSQDFVPANVERAVWVVSCRKSAKPYPLVFRFRDQNLDHELIVDGKTYYSPVGVWGEGDAFSLQEDLPEYKFLGFIPSLDFYWKGQCVVPLDAWLLGYLVIVIPLALLLKPVMHIY